MKIAHVMLCGPVTDGWNYQDNMLTKYQKKNGHSVVLITSKWVWNNENQLVKFDKSDYLNEHGNRVYRLDIKGDKPFNTKFKRYIGLYQCIEKVEPDIIFVHGISFLDIGAIISYKKKNQNVKIYVDNHSDFSNSATNWLSRTILHGIIWRFMANKIAPYTEKFYGVLPARVDFLINVYHLPKDKCELLVMGVDDELAERAEKDSRKDEIRKMYGISDSDFLIVSGGKIDSAKGQTLLLMEAINKSKNEKLKLLVFGSIEDTIRKEFDQLLKKNKVMYAGWINAVDSYDYFAAADLVVFPGRHSVFWEQVAGQGIPMVCKYWAGTTHIDLNGNMEFLYEDKVEEIQKTIENIASNKEYYNAMKKVAHSNRSIFLYSDIARRSIQN